MASDKIRQWIQKKLEKGIDKSRIKKSLENTGHDPGLVDEVESSGDVGDAPFDQTEGSEESSEEKEMDLEFDSSEEKQDSQDSDSGRSFPVSRPDFSRRTFAVLGASMLIALGMAGVFTYVESSGVLEPQCSGDEGAGVKVYSASSDSGVTTAEVKVYEDVPVVLEVFDSGEKVGQKVEDLEVEVRKSISVNVEGNRVSFHEYGCEAPSVERVTN
jgi:hypothetical protein